MLDLGWNWKDERLSNTIHMKNVDVYYPLSQQRYDVNVVVNFLINKQL